MCLVRFHIVHEESVTSYVLWKLIDVRAEIVSVAHCVIIYDAMFDDLKSF